MTAYTQSCSRSIAGHPAGVLEILTEILCKWMKNQHLKFQLAHERRQLRDMSDAMLRDIGIDHAAALSEAARSDMPESRRI
jgi:uncharacterized protein YjiS (DUF1127 family)